jgi:FHA domain
MDGLTEFWPPAALATIVAAAVSAGVAFFVARHQTRSAAAREMHDRQSDMSLDISKLLLEPAKAHAASRRFAIAVVKILKSPDDDQKGLVMFIPYNSRVTIGRDEANDVVLSLNYVSRFHCGIVSDGNDVYLEDYCSTNGVHLNGERVPAGTSVRLANEDLVTICDYQLRFQSVHHSQVLSR